MHACASDGCAQLLARNPGLEPNSQSDRTCPDCLSRLSNLDFHLAKVVPGCVPAEEVQMSGCAVRFASGILASSIILAASLSISAIAEAESIPSFAPNASIGWFSH